MRRTLSLWTITCISPKVRLAPTWDQALYFCIVYLCTVSCSPKNFIHIRECKYLKFIDYIDFVITCILPKVRLALTWDQALYFCIIYLCTVSCSPKNFIHFNIAGTSNRSWAQHQGPLGLRTTQTSWMNKITPPPSRIFLHLQACFCSTRIYYLYWWISQ